MKWFTLYAPVKGIEEIDRLALTNMHPSRILDYWVLQFVLKGRRTVRIGNEMITATAGEYFLLPPHVPHYGAELDEHDIIYFHFRMAGKEIPTPNRINTQGIILPICEKYPYEPNILDHVMFLVNNYRFKYIDTAFFSANLLSILSHLGLYAQRNSFWNKPHEILSDNIMKFIIDHLQEDLTCSSFESHFQMSYKQLNNIFSEKYHKTIKKKLTEHRIQHASHLLLQGCSIAETSAQCGFSDYFYFLRVFKRIKGLTPKEFQAQYLIT